LSNDIETARELARIAQTEEEIAAAKAKLLAES
jgi:hypothetical protein